MSCCPSECRKLHHIAACVDADNPLLVGVIDEIDTDVIVFARNSATQKLQRFEVTSTATGAVLIEEDLRFITAMPMEFYIRASDDVNGANLTIDDVYECVEFIFGNIN